MMQHLCGEAPPHDRPPGHVSQGEALHFPEDQTGECRLLTRDGGLMRSRAPHTHPSFSAARPPGLPDGEAWRTWYFSSKEVVVDADGPMCVVVWCGWQV